MMNYQRRNTRFGDQNAPPQKRPSDQPRRKRRNPLKDIDYIDFVDIKLLQRFLNDQGKLLPRRITGINAKQQHALTRAVKYARHLALLPFVAEDVR